MLHMCIAHLCLLLDMLAVLFMLLISVDGADGAHAFDQRMSACGYFRTLSM